MKFRVWLYYILIALLLLIFIGCALYVGDYILDSKASREHYDRLTDLVEQLRQENPPSPTGDTPAATAPEGTAPAPEMLPEYAALYELNPDVVGWLRIEGTQVNYPVMQTPESRDYYLRRNFDREYDVHGCLYAREECDIQAPSDNITIYGHHMINGSMFGGLEKFARKAYWEEHPTLDFDTLWEYHSYEIFAVFRTTASEGEGFAYHLFADAGSEAEFDEFIGQCRELSLYETGIVPKYGDKIICLSTCEYTRENGRFVVAAVRKE